MGLMNNFDNFAILLHSSPSINQISLRGKKNWRCCLICWQWIYLSIEKSSGVFSETSSYLRKNVDSRNAHFERISINKISLSSLLFARNDYYYRSAANVQSIRLTHITIWHMITNQTSSAIVDFDIRV